MVRLRSRTLRAPALTTATGVRASSTRSAEMSKPMCGPAGAAPPMAPVATSGMPARQARYMLAATVVAAVACRTIVVVRSRRLALMVLAPRLSVSTSAGARPTVGRPCQTATTARSAPSSRASSSTRRTISRFSGQGTLYAMGVEAKATTGRPALTASAISGRTSSGICVCMASHQSLPRRRTGCATCTGETLPIA